MEYAQHLQAILQIIFLYVCVYLNFVANFVF